MLTVASMGILDSSSHKDEAQQYIAFAASEEGQQSLTDESSQYPLNDQADTQGLKPFSELTPPEGTPDLGEYSNGDEEEKLLQDVGLLKYLISKCTFLTIDPFHWYDYNFFNITMLPNFVLYFKF